MCQPFFPSVSQSQRKKGQGACHEQTLLALVRDPFRPELHCNTKRREKNMVVPVLPDALRLHEMLVAVHDHLEPEGPPTMQPPQDKVSQDGLRERFERLYLESALPPCAQHHAWPHRVRLESTTLCLAGKKAETAALVYARAPAAECHFERLAALRRRV
jgi:hypothetical protein